MILKGFKKFNDLKIHPLDLQMKGGWPAVNRLYSRVRIARSFRGLKLQGYSDRTVLGYDALFQAFLTYSALEQFIRVMYQARSVHDIEDYLAPYPTGEIVALFGETDPEHRFLNFVEEHVERSRYKECVQQCKAGTLVNVAALLAAIRHIFVHGHLSVHSNRANPAHVQTLCNTLSDFHLDFMDAEFSSRVDAYIPRPKTGSAETRPFRVEFSGDLKHRPFDFIGPLILAVMVREFVRDDPGYLHWIAAHPGGYVINTTPGRSPNYMVLHRATCRRIGPRDDVQPGGFTGRSYIKICADEERLLRAWVREHGRPDGSFSSERCSCLRN